MLVYKSVYVLGAALANPVFVYLRIAVKGQGVLGHLKSEQLAYHVLRLLKPGIAELQNLAAIVTDQVIVLAVPVSLLVKGCVIAKLLFDREPAVQKKIQGIVNRSTADLVVFLLKLKV